ncbi:MAG: nitroreductase family protein [Acholeplasmatales bacterium]|nr:nitroreductase family protein [Acholeplasmatales bacterium]
MDYFEVLEKRYSCRKFTDQEVEDDKINKILEAGRLSPTAVNFQPERIYVCKSKEILEKLSSACKYTFNAKLIFVIAYDSNVSWKRRSDGTEFGPVDAAIVTTNMMNAATALGLGSTFVCSMHEDKVEEILGLPNNIKVLSLLPVGYPAEVKAHGARKNIEEIVEYR